MHDCRLDGGHFFVYRPQGHAFRCRRCSERFVNSWTDPALKHPWKCILERCEYIACDPCSTILMEELAPPEKKKKKDEKQTQQQQQQSGEGVRRADAIELYKVEQRQRRVTLEAGGAGSAVVEQAGMTIMEADEEDAEYEVPTFVCRTARQAAAEAAIKRAYVKRSTRQVARIE